MSSPTKLLQVQNVYASSPGKLHVLPACPSPSKKRRPTERKPGASGLSPLPGIKDGKTIPSSLSLTQWKQWMHEAQEMNASSSMFLATTSSKSLAQATNEGLELVLNPVVTRTDERLAALIEARTVNLTVPTSEIFAPKHSPELDQIQHWRARVSKSRKRRKTASFFTVEPLLSTEVTSYFQRLLSFAMPTHVEINVQMRTKLQSHLEDKIKGDIWENEIRSRLARPLSASTFCSRVEQLRHPLSGPQFLSADGQNPANNVGLPRFPFSFEAHAFVNRIRRCRLKACYRAALKARARLVAIAVRVLRRRGVPLLIRGFRRRRLAAIRIQRRYRRFLRWRSDFLRPFVCANVTQWMQRGIVLTSARVIIARGLRTLYQARKLRQDEAERRAAHLRRYAAKTRVCLFVHQIWTVRWFHNKRSRNVENMKRELALFEASDRDVHLQYAAIFATPIGKDSLKKELVAWRIGAQQRASRETSSAEESADPVVMRLRQCFQIFDLDGSGTLDLDEFQIMLSYLRGKKQQPKRGSVGGSKSAQQPPKLTTAQVRNLFAELDRDGNGGITCQEVESWWTKEHERATLSTSASTNVLSRGLDGLVFQSHGLLFWLLGRKQQLERKFVKKLLARRAMEKAKRELLQAEIDRELMAGASAGVFRCCSCGRRFGLGRDLEDHVGHDCTSLELVVDTFTLKKWVHEEEFRLLEDVNDGQLQR